MKQKKSTNFSKKNNKKIDLISIIILIAPFMVGVMPLWSAYLLSLICLIGLIYQVIKKKKIILPKGKNIIFVLIYLVSFLIVDFYAIDKGMNMLAFFKNLSILIFLLLYLQYDYDEEKQKKIFSYIPYSGAISVVFSLILSALSIIDIFWDNRLQGIFFYANTYGIFLLIGVLITILKEKLQGKDFIVSTILALGIIFTNSRAIILLLFFVLLVGCIMNKKNRKQLISVSLSIIFLFGSIYLFSNMENRITTEMFSSSEFITRLLYYKDAIEMIKENPFGYGYEGWYYKQVEIQTGVYDTKFVHNSILQVILDVGIIPALALMILLVGTFFDKKQSVQNRLILLILLGHSLIDIDLAYLYFILLIVMIIDFEKFEVKKNNLMVVSSTILTLCYFVLFLSTLCYEVGNYKNAYAIIPFYTEALQAELYQTMDEKEQVELAEKIYLLNKNVSGVYQAFSNELRKENRYDEALNYEKKRLGLNKYNMMNYLDYTEFLIEALQYYFEQNDLEKVKQYKVEICDVETKINETINNTNPLCYQTAHTPNLEIPNEMKAFTEEIKLEVET